MITQYFHECEECGKEQRYAYRSEEDATDAAERAGWRVDGEQAWCPPCGADAIAENAREEAAERDADDRRHGV